jgi:exopolysaccharide production protein ExoQ
MADNSIGRPLYTARQSKWADLSAQFAFAGVLFLVFVGLQPFASRDNIGDFLLASGEGDLPRQISYILAFIIVVGLAYSFRGKKALKAIPISFAIVLLWCLLSVTWAIEPGIALRRLLLTIIVVSCVMCSVDVLGTQRSLQTLWFVLAIVLIVSCVSLLFVPQAVHLPFELEGELAGDWRGLYYHKNIAGPATALSALLFYHYGLATRRWIDWLLFATSVIFLIGTHSKSAIGFFLASIVISTTYRQMYRTEMGRLLFRFLLVAVLLTATFAWIVAYDTIADLMTDPNSFTGRVAIWQTVFAYLQDHWLLGAGYSSFWQIGEASPALSIAYESWVGMAAHSHNGYVEILVTTGVIGLFLAVAVFVILPVKQLLGSNTHDVDLKSLLFALVFFVVFENLLENIFLDRDRPEWVIFLIVLAILHQMAATKGRTAKLAPTRKQP